jgi:hypothetical protein
MPTSLVEIATGSVGVQPCGGAALQCTLVAARVWARMHCMWAWHVMFTYIPKLPCGSPAADASWHVLLARGDAMTPAAHGGASVHCWQMLGSEQRRDHLQGSIVINW